MANTHETIADIIAEIRALSNPISDGIIAINGKSIADRLDAAHKREKTAIEADALTVGGMVEAARKRERESDDAKIADLQSRVKLWTDRSAELVKKCDENYANIRKSNGGNAAKLRERRLLMSCARWILCHDIYGHTAKELLAECKEVLNDDGHFLFKEDEQ